MKELFRLVMCAILLSLLPGCREASTPEPMKQVTASTVPVPIPEKKKIVGGGCDGCEIMYVGMPSDIQSVDTSAGWFEKGKRLVVSGTVYKMDSKTPAPNVIIYYWQTDAKGYYSPKEGLDQQAIRHGHIRGWVKSDQQGHYAIYTIRPAPYPDRNLPAHIHLSIKEPDIDNEYYVDELVFEDDPFLTEEKKDALENRGGSGILKISNKKNGMTSVHDIILGMNIPDYPAASHSSSSSGLEIGEDDPSFTPYHAFGPDKGTWTCPLCKYGGYHGILYFVGNHPDWSDIRKWVVFLEQESVSRPDYLKAFFVYGNENDFNAEARAKELEDLGNELDIQNVALTFVPSMTDTATEVFFNKINPDVGNTFIIYQQGEIVDKYVDIAANADNFNRIVSTIDKPTMTEILNVKAPSHQ